jgi:hypothetical protein
VVRIAEDGERELVNLYWGFVLLQKDLAPRLALLPSASTGRAP